MPEWIEEVELELEALRATYGDDLSLDEPTGVVSMLLQPSGTAQEAYSQCLLQLTLPSGYPEAAAPGIALQDARGLGSSRLHTLQGLLQREADGMLGEMMLGQLFECGRDWLNDNNWPEGPCIFCLEELCTAGSSSGSSSSGACMRLPCFHAFHQSCFADWWCWQQQALREQQQQLEQRTGATAAAALAQEQLPIQEDGHFQLTCPSCRAGFSLQQDLQHLVQHLTKQQQQQQQQQHVRQSPLANSSSPGSRLTLAELAPFRDIQRRHAVLFAEQQKRQGIIVDASYSITDVPVGAAAAADGSTAGGSRGGISRAQSSRGCSSNHNGSRGGDGSRGGTSSRGSSSSSSSSAVHHRAPADVKQPTSSSRSRGGAGSSNAYAAGRGSSRAGRGHHSADRPAVQSVQVDGKYDSRHDLVPISSGRGGRSRGRSGRGRGPQQQTGVGVNSN